MAFTNNHWIRHRPFLYHFAPAANIERIIKRREMLSAEVIVRKAYAYDPTQVLDPTAFLRTPRKMPIALRVGPLAEDLCELNDQLPMLHESSFAKLDGTREDFIELLNAFVFYWPGGHDGPVTKGDHGQSFRKRYKHFAELRIPVANVWTDRAFPKFCRFNSGAPQARDRVKRGPSIFVGATDTELETRKVVEVVFPNQVALPPSTQWRDNGFSDWRKIGT
jgi:hypothetical protein